ncbi:MAG: TonB-dependent receptor [Chitinivibrionia bacterium]|nr:TonB-dependent receptor [Chitinivibrionia bacterium]
MHNTLFYIQGDGFFDYDGSWADTTYYRITREFGFAPGSNPGKSLIRAHVANKQGGWLPRLSVKHARGELNAGLEARYHQSVHWGTVLWAQNLASGVPADRRYYEYKGAKTIVSAYADEGLHLADTVVLKASVQAIYNGYRIFDEAFAGNDFRVSYLFMNPRIGINVNFTDQTNGYVSYSRTGREPRLKNLYDAAESSGGAVPQFSEIAPGEYDFDDPLVKPEVLDDFELGYHVSANNAAVSLNLFYMGFRDEIVKSGGLDRFGIPRTGNAERTSHKGLELAAEYEPRQGLKMNGNASFSKNTLDRYTLYDSAEEYMRNPPNPDSTVAYVLDGNRLAGFAGVLWNLRVSFKVHRFDFSVWAHHEGKKYTNNFEGAWYASGEPRPETVVDPSTVMNASMNCHIDRLWSLRNIDLIVQVFNVTDALYATHGEGGEFYPAATRNVYAGIEIGM